MKGEKEESQTQSNPKFALVVFPQQFSHPEGVPGVPTALPGNGAGAQLGHSWGTTAEHELWPSLGAQAKVHKAPADPQQCKGVQESWNWKCSPGSWGPSSSPALCAPVPHPGVFHSSRMSQFPGQLVWIKACQPLQWGHFSCYAIQTCPVSSAPAPLPGEQNSANKENTTVQPSRAVAREEFPTQPCIQGHRKCRGETLGEVTAHRAEAQTPLEPSSHPAEHVPGNPWTAHTQTKVVWHLNSFTAFILSFGL